MQDPAGLGEHFAQGHCFYPTHSKDEDFMKRTTRASILIAAIAMSGCVTTEDLRSHAALIDVTSTKPARAVAACITAKWEKSGVFGAPMDVSNTVLEDGYSISVKQGHVVQMLADVRDSGTGSTVKFYKPGFVMATGKFEAAIGDCK